MGCLMLHLWEARTKKGTNEVHRQTEKYSSASKVTEVSENLPTLYDGKEFRNGR